MKTYGGGVRVEVAPPFLTSALQGGEWSAPRPSNFTPWEAVTDTNCMGGCVGLRDDLEAVTRKIFPCRESKLGRPARILSYPDHFI